MAGQKDGIFKVDVRPASRLTILCFISPTGKDWLRLNNSHFPLKKKRKKLAVEEPKTFPVGKK